MDACARQTADFTVRSGVQLPVGATITRISGYVIDSNATNGAIRLIRTTGVTHGPRERRHCGYAGASSGGVNLPTPELVSAGEYFLIEYAGGDGTTAQQVCGAEIDYTSPAGVSILSTDANQDDPAGVPSGTE